MTEEEAERTYPVMRRAMLARNRLALSEEMLQRVVSVRVAVVGIGGIGSVTAEQLTRLGTDRMMIAARGAYDFENVNRQIAATCHAVRARIPKIDAMAARIAEISPFVAVEPVSVDVAANPETLRKALTDYGPKVVFNCVDEYLAQHVTAELAREMHATLIVTGVIGNGEGGIVTTVPPTGASYEEVFGVEECRELRAKGASREAIDARLREGWLERHGSSLQPSIRELYESGGERAYPVLTPVPWALASIGIMEFVKCVLSDSAVKVPEAIVLNLSKCELRIVDLRKVDGWEYNPWRP